MNDSIGKRMLVIDDDPLVRELFETYLEMHGFEVLAAEDGTSGLRLLREQDPDLVLCDMRMPGIDGLEVLKQVREEKPQKPVIMVSGAGSINDVVEALRLGAWDYLLKPLSDKAVLIHAVSNCLRRAQLENENLHYRRQLEEANKELKTSLAVLREDQEAGRRVQAALLPAPESCFGAYCFSHMVIPSLYLSGDFLDYFEIDDRFLGFYLADVSGHGSSSAFVTVILKTLITELLRDYKKQQEPTILGPDRVFAHLNSELLAAGLGKYFTMFYAVLDRTTHELSYAIGGHYPRPLISTDGSLRYLPGEGFPIGLFDFAEYHAESMILPNRFGLAMFSDGVFEVIDEGAGPDKEAALQKLCSLPDLSIPLIKERLQISQRSGLADDITVLLLRRKEDHGS